LDKSRAGRIQKKAGGDATGLSRDSKGGGGEETPQLNNTTKMLQRNRIF
jgi:hypothetical protein